MIHKLKSECGDILLKSKFEIFPELSNCRYEHKSGYVCTLFALDSAPNKLDIILINNNTGETSFYGYVINTEEFIWVLKRCFKSHI